MKKSVIQSYFSGLTNFSQGESYSKILGYFFYEYITALLLYSALHLLDAYFIGHLKSTSIYATVGVTGVLIHLMIKVAEGFSIGSVVLCGQHNGAKDYKSVGKTFVESFWVTFVVSFSFASMLYLGAYWIYYYFGVTPRMIEIGIPFLKLRAIGLFLTFLYFAFIAFFRSIKDTKTPMYIFSAGAVAFIFFDYSLIFGKFGFPELKMLGSAYATIIQYSVMLLLVFFNVLCDKEKKKYSIHLFSHISLSSVKRLLKVSWPIIIDKATIALAYIWLGSMIAPLGKCAIASFTVIKDLERIAFLPAIACAQVITLLVSNDFGASNFDAIKTNIKKMIFIASIFVFLSLAILLTSPRYFISIFDQKNAFTDFAVKAFPILAPFVFLDLVQLILSGALRGIGAVRVVMWTRLAVCCGLFLPLSYIIAHTTMENDVMKFILIYGIFYISSIFMNFIYINKFRSDEWKTPGF